jgi:hypothetical protein
MSHTPEASNSNGAGSCDSKGNKILELRHEDGINQYKTVYEYGSNGKVSSLLNNHGRITHGQTIQVLSTVMDEAKETSKR